MCVRYTADLQDASDGIKISPKVNLICRSEPLIVHLHVGNVVLREER